MNVAVLFGGTGFIGSYFAEHLLGENKVDKVILADIRPICGDRFLGFLKEFKDAGRLEYIECDVRKPIDEQLKVEEKVALIANFAAIHREPGHEPAEYYETNIYGAENICEWCDLINCHDLIFTSSIAPYGAAEDRKDEASLPVPLTPYGASKLVAEKIHISWQKSSPENQLTVVRPGVVFGPGEGGNVSRLIKAVLGGYFFYMGNQETRKAGVYVKELAAAMLWVHSQNKMNDKPFALFNMSMELAPSMKEYVDTILKVSNRNRLVLSIPFLLLYPISFVVNFLSTLLKINQPINPVRIKKLVKSNYIDPKYLRDKKYEYKYTLLTALTDWKKQMPEEW
ncbi:MAG: NAD(P)-dependent oxidoreductase [Colwellia sp.]|jgi:Nucleoside-diphosphate-sugar epimerases